MNNLSLLIEEDEKKYFWLQSKILNGYTISHRYEKDPNGWKDRQEAFQKLKTWFKYDKDICKGEKQLIFDTEGRAPWMDVAIKEIINYGGKHESSIDSRIRQYHKEGRGNSEYTSKTAWCSSFVCWCLANSNPKYKSPSSAGSRFFLTHSSLEPCEVFFGAIAVFSDCYSTGTNIKTSGHVSFVFGKLLDKKDTYALLGGNQGDMITLSPNYRFHGKAFPMNKKKTAYKIFRGFFKPKGYVIKEEDKLNKDDEYVNLEEANKKLKQKTQDTSKGESSR